MKVRSFLPILSLALALASPTVMAMVGSEAIKASVDAFMVGHIAKLQQQYGEQLRIEHQVSNLDPRLSMADCPAPIQSELKSKGSSGRINVKVSCQGQKPWSLYVPVNIKRYRLVVTTIAPVARGTKLDYSHLELREMDTSRLNGTYFSQLEEVIGQQAKRNLRADKTVIAGQLSPPLMVKKGDALVLTAQSGSLMVKIPAIALMDGKQGQQISVRNRQSKRVVDARVTGPGRVSVMM